MPGLYPDNPIRCDDCSTHFVLSPGHASDGLACPECGGKRLFRDQPSPTQSDGTLRDMVDSASQKDNGGNPLGEGSIMGSPGDGMATQPAWRRDEGTYAKTASPALYDIAELRKSLPMDQQHAIDSMLTHEGTAATISYLRQLNPQPMASPMGSSPPYWDGMVADQPYTAATSVTQRVEMRLPNMEPYMPWTHEASVHTAGPALLAPAIEGEAAALPAEIGAAGAAAGAVGDAAEAGGGLIGDAWGGLKGLFGGAAKKVPGQIAGTLMKGALGVGGAGGQQAGGMAPEPVTQAPNMMAYGSADIPMLLVADLQTPTSNPSVDEIEDDPEKQDQKEFNDGDHDPSNPHNPNNEDSGSNGEDGVKDKTPGYGFGENSPGIERLMMVLPLLLHYFQSPDSGEQDPIIKALHDTLESENPGYLDNEDPNGPGMVEMIIQHHKNPQGVTAGVGGAYPSGLPAMPGGGAQAPGGGTCPQCGGPLGPDGSCPQCAAGGQAAVPGMGAAGGQPPNPAASLPPMLGNHVGPVTPEQISAVAQLLIDQGRSGEIDTMKRAPQLYQDELQQIQQNPTPSPPLIDPAQSQPPAPMDPAQGGMPVPDMGTGAAGGQPMQPMSGFQAHLREAGLNAMPYPETDRGWNNWSPDDMAGDPQLGDCPQCHQRTMSPYTGQCQNGDCRYQIPQDSRDVNLDQFAQQGAGAMSRGDAPMDLDTLQPHWGSAKEADANNRVPRCPKCNSATTTLVSGADNDPSELLGKCHNPGCFNIWKLKPDHKEGRRVWADVPNPVMLPAADQHAPTDREHMQDPTMQWVDNEGQQLQTNQVYELYSPAYSVPDMIRIVDVKPDAIQVQLVGMYSNGDDDGSQPFDISRHEAQLEHYEFVSQADEQNMDDRNTEPPSGTPGLEQVPPSGPTTDQVDANPSTLSHVHENDEDPGCLKCGSTTVDHNMVSPERRAHDCVRCGHYWETEDHFQGRAPGSDLSWVLGSNMPDDDFDFERHQAMTEAGGQSRNISDIAAKDPRLQHIKSVLDANDQARTAGRQFTHSEKRELIDEQGRARNLGDLDLSNTHYDARVDYTGKANSENVDDSHFALGI